MQTALEVFLLFPLRHKQISVVVFLPLPACSPLQLLEMFGSLLERPVIAAHAASKYSDLVHMFSSALSDVRLIYSRHVRAELELGE